MSVALRLVVLSAAALLAFAGISFGANLQEERFLDTDDERDFGGQPGVAGNLIPFTGLLVAAGAALAALALARRPLTQCLTAVAQVAAGVWLLVVLVQSNYPNYNVLVEARYAEMTISSIIVDATANPLVLVPVMALLVAGVLLAGRGLRQLLSTVPGASPALPTDGRRLYHGHVGLVLLCLPFLFATALGALALLIALRVQEPGHGLALALLPLLGVAAMALAVLLLMRTWALAETASRPRMALVSAEMWRTLGRIQVFVMALFALAALAGSFLPRTAMGELELGRVLGFSLRSGVQAALFVLLPLGVLWLHDRRVQRVLDGGVVLPAYPGARRYALVTLIVASSAFLVAGLTVLLADSALLAWTLPLLVIALLAATTLPALPAAPVMLLTAAALWGHGNTVSAVHNPSALTLLDFHTNPGVLILWSLVAVTMLAWAVGRMVRAAGPQVRSVVALPMAAVVAVSLAVVIWLDLSFTAWIVPGQRSDGVAVGSLLRSLPRDVRAAIHIFNALFALAAAFALARVVRPEWFARRPARPEPIAAKTPGTAQAP